MGEIKLSLQMIIFVENLKELTKKMSWSAVRVRLRRELLYKSQLLFTSFNN